MTARDVILVIIRYRFLTVDLLVKVLGGKRDAADKLLRELESRGVLQSQVVAGRQKVYFLSAATCREYGQPESRAKPFAAQGLITNLGILLYCARHGVKRFTKEEIQTHQPKLIVPGISADRYAMPEADQLRLLVVDHGSSVRRLAGKVRKEWMKRREHIDWQLLQDHHQFGVVVIVARPGKASRLSSMLQDDDLKVSLEVYPELQKLVVRKDS